MFNLKRNKPPYTQEQIKEQQGIVAEAIKSRSELRGTREYDRASVAIECAQEILNFMLEEIATHGRK